MKRYALAAIALVLTSFLVASSPRPSATVGAEVERIQVHLAGAERLLESRDLATLTPDQKRARAIHVSRLREYRDRGVFPHNHDFPGERRPYFVDEHGVLCAMAYLISKSGRDDIVRLVEQSRNNATVMELATDPAIGPVLAVWLDEAGLTVAEAQRIQPEYGWGSVGLEEETISTEYAAASGLVGGLNLTTSVLNLTSGTEGYAPWTGYAGVLGGLAGMGLGGAILIDGKYEDGTALAISNVVVGTFSTI
ncbi:MAG TPA: hypothetical protein VFP58_00020, partial [Candidatus Eisenbacteria bacterium]|nr:hypothetical protein [Candidatus Eisenbacteria bacterium]